MLRLMDEPEVILRDEPITSIIAARQENAFLNYNAIGIKHHRGQSLCNRYYNALGVNLFVIDIIMF